MFKKRSKTKMELVILKLLFCNEHLTYPGLQAKWTCEPNRALPFTKLTWPFTGSPTLGHDFSKRKCSNMLVYTNFKNRFKSNSKVYFACLNSLESYYSFNYYFLSILYGQKKSHIYPGKQLPRKRFPGDFSKPEQMHRYLKTYIHMIKSSLK